MPKLPFLYEVQASRDMISDFGGLNLNPRINQNEFTSLTNMGPSMYPALSPRQKRGRVRQFTKPNGLFAHDKLCWVDGTNFYYDGVVKGTVADSPKQLVAMGAYILIWPDKKYYNTVSHEFGSLGASFTSTGTVTVSLCSADGTVYTTVSGKEPPASPEVGDYWVDTSGSPHVLRQYSVVQGMWTAVPTVHVRIAHTGIGTNFSQWDGVTLSGLTDTALNGNFVIYAKNADWIVIKALIDSQFTQATAAKVERIIPDMDFITESENRIWGCSSANHEIYACKQGDAKNWNSFLGISTDSYAVTVGSAGNFTGCCTHLGYVIFFKQNVLHKIYGNKPANYQLTNTACRGVDEGSEKSLVIVNETLFYKSRYDVCAYNSALPASVSQALGSDYFSDAVSGAVAGMLYISMLEASGSYGMYVLDTARGLWYREDDTHVSYFAAYGPDLYFIDDDDKCLYSVRGGLADYPDNNAALEGALAWSAETGDIGMELPDAKYVSKLQLRLEIEQGALLCIEAQYDRSGIWQEVFRINSTRKRSYTVPIIPVRCDTMRLRLSGRGDCVVYSLAKTVEQGSDS